MVWGCFVVVLLGACWCVGVCECVWGVVFFCVCVFVWVCVCVCVGVCVGVCVCVCVYVCVCACVFMYINDLIIVIFVILL